jgi:hypothetical protein
MVLLEGESEGLGLDGVDPILVGICPGVAELGIPLGAVVLRRWLT